MFPGHDRRLDRSDGRDRQSAGGRNGSVDDSKHTTWCPQKHNLYVYSIQFLKSKLISQWGWEMSIFLVVILVSYYLVSCFVESMTIIIVVINQYCASPTLLLLNISSLMDSMIHYRLLSYLTCWTGLNVSSYWLSTSSWWLYGCCLI